MRKSRGFTLIEAILYIAITSIILTSLISVAYQLMWNGRKLEMRTMATVEADFLLKKINSELKEPADISKFKVEGENLLWKRNENGFIQINSALIEGLSFAVEDNFIHTIITVEGRSFETIKYFK